MRKYIRNFVVCLMVLLTALLPCGVMTAEADTVIMGDVDGDGAVSSADAHLIQRYVVKLQNLTGNQLKVADVSGDGLVSTVDAFRILRHIAGYTNSIVNGDDDENDFAKEVVRLVNYEREKKGLSPLVLDEKLSQAAYVRAKEAEVQFSHTRPNGKSWSTVLSEFNINYTAAAENIAAGQRTPEAVVQAWMNSEGHRKNIMSSEYKKIGVGYYFDSNSTYGHYWEQLFTD